MDEAKKFTNVREAFFLQFESKEQPEDTIPRAMDDSLDSAILTKSMSEEDIQYKKEVFKDEARSRLLYVTSMSIMHSLFSYGAMHH